MRVQITDLQREVAIPRAAVRRATLVAAAEDPSLGALHIVFVDDQKIREVNRRFLGRNRYTDVIAFDYRGGPDSSESMSGEVVISTGRAAMQARRRRVALVRELLLYAIHGVLHLRGFDDHRPEDIRAMRREERRALEAVANLWRQ